MSHASEFATYVGTVLGRSDVLKAIDDMVAELVVLRSAGGRLFVLGVGGGAANAAHAVNDFRKLCGIEAYAPTDSVAELTARANDEGWSTVFVEWLRGSRLTSRDVLLVFSVGGGTEQVSKCIKDAVDYACAQLAVVLGVVGKRDGAVARLSSSLGHAVVKVQAEAGASPLLTAVTETVQIAVLHALVSDPRLQTKETKW